MGLSKRERREAALRELRLREDALGVPRERFLYILGVNYFRYGGPRPLIDRSWMDGAVFDYQRKRYENPTYDGRPLQSRLQAAPDNWTPLEVMPEISPLIPDDAPLADFSMWGSNLMIFSDRAINAIKPHLDGSGPLLSLSCDDGDFTGFHLRMEKRVLDADNSKATWAPWERDGHRVAHSIHVYHFITELIEPEGIFRIPENGETLVPQGFVDAVDREQLCGFTFQQVWPMALAKHWGDVMRY